MASPVPDTGFAPVSYEQWAAAVAADLGPDALDRRLRTATEDGIVLDALHAPATAAAGAGVGEAVAALATEARRARGREGWLVRQRLDAATLRQPDLRDEVAGGADSVELDLARVEPLGVAARAGALAATVWKAGAEVAFVGLREPAVLLDVVRAGGAGALALGYDPLGAWVRAGAAGPPAQALEGLLGIDPWLQEAPRGPLLRASGEPWHDAGATPAWTVALVAAAALEYVRWLQARGVEAGRVAGALELVLPLGADAVEGIAAVRALRLVWARVLEELGEDPLLPPRVVATFGRRGLARRDPWVNTLRETAAAFAGAVGGADVLQLPAFDARLHDDDPAARRLARNTVLILREEAGLQRVTDPAGGSWHLDAFTGLLAARAWEKLDEVEAAGGLAAALAGGLVERRLEEARGAREDAVRTRKRPLVGVSEFADVGERDRTLVRAVEPSNPRFGLRAEAEVFERLRDVADGWAAAQGRAPALFLARLGAPRESAARAAFVRGVAHAGGFEAVGPDGVADADAAARAFAGSGALVAVLCGADAAYAGAAGIACALRDAGARLVLVAGRPGEHAEALRAAGVGGWVHQGADVAAVLAKAQLVAGVHP